MNEIIYQSTKKQKIIFASISIALLSWDIDGFLYLFLFLLKPIEGEEFLFEDFFAMLPGLLSIIAGLLFFMKIGVQITKNELSKVYQLFGKTLKSEKLPSKFAGLTILKFTYKEENETGDPIDSVHAGRSYQVFGLNESHSKRRLIFEVQDSQEAQRLIKILSEKLNTPIVNYNPPAARRRKSRRK
ncbi:MAG: hypothetical protein ACPG6V_13395 [Flavobacteriales bacterium]